MNIINLLNIFRPQRETTIFQPTSVKNQVTVCSIVDQFVTTSTQIIDFAKKQFHLNRIWRVSEKIEGGRDKMKKNEIKIEPSSHNQYLKAHILCVLNNYERWTGNQLYKSDAATTDLPQEIYNAPFVIVSHGTESDPIFNYANKKAQELWEMNWQEFTRLPSKNSAEQPSQEERQRLLNEVTKNGYIGNYSGVRISKSGRRFIIKNAVVWNLLDEDGKYCGQAAAFHDWEFI